MHPETLTTIARRHQLDLGTLAQHHRLARAVRRDRRGTRAAAAASADDERRPSIAPVAVTACT